MNTRRWLLVASFACLGFPALGGTIPEDPLQTLSAQEQFLSSLQAQQEQNTRSIQQNNREILYLEKRVAENEAEAARKQSQLAGPDVYPSQTRAELEAARVERDQLRAQLERRQHAREQLVQDEKKLRGLEAEYEADPERAGELLESLQ